MVAHILIGSKSASFTSSLLACHRWKAKTLPQGLTQGSIHSRLQQPWSQWSTQCFCSAISSSMLLRLPIYLSHLTVECSVELRINREVDVRGHCFLDILNVMKTLVSYLSWNISCLLEIKRCHYQDPFTRLDKVLSIKHSVVCALCSIVRLSEFKSNIPRGSKSLCVPVHLHLYSVQLLVAAVGPYQATSAC